MPKIVDHDATREALARRAAGLFSEHGYSGLGMRAIAEALGLSKSALYHYFPSKRALFLACTAAVTAPPERAAEARADDPVEALLALATALRPGFAGEMSLLFDYLRGMEAGAIAEDPAMRMALARYEAQIGAITGPEAARSAFALILGALMLDHFSGGSWPAPELGPALARLLSATPRR